MAEVTLAERVRLAHAAVQWHADAHDIRILHVKGPVREVQFPGRERWSSDVDVLVDPARVDELAASMCARGWTRYASFDPSALGTHATVLGHHVLGVTADLHHFFPGLAVEPQEAFEVLWEARANQDIAGRPCPVPNRVDHALVLLLHAVRNAQSLRGRQDLSDVADALSTAEEDLLLDRSRRLRAGAALQALLPHHAHDDDDPRLARYWQLQSAGAPGVALWLGRLRAERGLIARMGVLRAALFPHPPGGQEWNSLGERARGWQLHLRSGLRQLGVLGARVRSRWNRGVE